MPQAKTAVQTHYDMIVVGGGVYGAAVLWEASHRGLKVLLLEKNDFCSGTSANSLKTIHGGIRYLQSLDFKRTMDSDQEKAVLKTIAPNIIEPLACNLAASNYTTKSFISFFAATKLYNLLTNIPMKGSGRLKGVFTPSSANRKVTLFNQNLKPSAAHRGKTYMVWQDAQVTNSEYLSLAFIESSLRSGGEARNYTEVTEITREEGVFKVLSSSQKAGEGYSSADTIVDCSAGSLQVTAANQKMVAKPYNAPDYVAGINLILSEQFSEQAFALELNDPKPGDTTLGKQGLLFFSPWKGSSLVGTWYFPKAQVSSRAEVSEEVIAICLNDIARAFQEAGFRIDITSLGAMLEDFHFGFLPANLAEKDAEKSIVERAVILESHDGFYELRGNKYTTARLNAKKMLDRMQSENVSIAESRSDVITLERTAIPSTETQKLFSGSRAWPEIVARYGEFATKLGTAVCDPVDDLELVPGSDSIYQIEVDYFAQSSLTHRLSDVLYRRLNINVHRAISRQTITWCAERMAEKLGWSDQVLEDNMAEVFAREKAKARLGEINFEQYENKQ